MKKILSILILLSLVLSGCQSKTSTNQEVPKEPEEQKEVDVKEEAKEIKIHDFAENDVVIPNKVERVVIDQVPILSTYMSFFSGKAPYIVGYAGSLKKVIENTVLSEIAPELLDASVTTQGQSDLNVEEIIKLKPDVILYNAQNKKHYEALSSTGIPLVGFPTIGAKTPADPINRNREWFELLAQIFPSENLNANMLDKIDEMSNEIAAKIDKIPQENRPRALILWKLADATPIVAGKGTFGDFWLKRIGVENVAADTKGYAKVNFEDIYQWDPDIIYLDGPGLLDLTPQQVFDNSVDGVDFSPLTAVSNKKVYNTKLGMWNWLTPNPDAGLVYGWLAQCAYPEEFKDFDLEAKIKDFYKEFYKYELSDDQIKDMLYK